MAGSTTSDALRWSALLDKPELPDKNLVREVAATTDAIALGSGG
eukprot:CAMPEP_0172833308 /NCGR_PEP_ID=MMETSP1075-20121228/24275_1 /TAXON_ID=2916 /ORGANISM="Ceratium fusus, Strain PA161109" /LENGTH=43 /DNA_ID= /DNA_START= /DNA_END= /DNA_ORIENTATION=